MAPYAVEQSLLLSFVLNSFLMSNLELIFFYVLLPLFLIDFLF
jgi:hypothetical protein